MAEQQVLVRQGDVLLLAVAGLPDGVQELAPDGRGLVLAEGEATGHAHAVVGGRARLLQEGRGSWRGNRRFLVVEQAAALVHEEHAPLELTPGVYELRRQREYRPDVWQRSWWVAD